MRKKIHFIPLLAIPILMIIFGSFFDLSISQALYVRQDGLGQFAAAFGCLPCFAGWGLCGGGIAYFGLTQAKTKGTKAFFTIVGFAAWACGIFFFGNIFGGVNGYNLADNQKWIGYLVGAVLVVAAGFAGYKLMKKNPSVENLGIMVFIGVVTGLGAGLPNLIKLVVYRPRYRFLISEDGSFTYFRNWWESGKQIWESFKDTVARDEFKSFPSGHAGTSAGTIVLLTYLPRLFVKKMRRDQTLGLYLGIIYTLLVCLSRITMGAHFLTDLGFGFLLTAVLMVVGDFIFFKNAGKEELKTEEIKA